MSDDDIKNIIQFPTDKIVRRVGKDQQSKKIQNKLNDQLKKQQTKQYIESLYILIQPLKLTYLYH